MTSNKTLQIKDILNFWISVYGIFTVDEFISEVKQFITEAVTLETIQKTIDLLEKEGQFIQLNEGLIYALPIPDPYNFLWLIEAREDLKRAKYSSQDMINFAAEGFAHFSEYYKALHDFLTLLTEDAFGADAIAQAMHFMHQSGRPISDIVSLTVKMLGRRLTTEEMRTLLDMWMEMSNDLPNWLNKGHIPNRNHRKGQAEDLNKEAFLKLVKKLEKSFKSGDFKRTMKLEECLENCPKEQLKDLAKFYNIKGRSKMNREMLGDALERAISLSIDLYTPSMTDHHLALLNNKVHDLKTDFALDSREDFLERGWAYTITDGYNLIVHIPPDLKTLLKKSFKAHQDQIAKNTQLFKAYAYAVVLFGVIPLDDFLSWASVGLGRIISEHEFYKLAINTSAVNYDPDTKLLYDMLLEEIHVEIYQRIQELRSDDYLPFDQHVFQKAVYENDNFLMPHYEYALVELDKERGLVTNLDLLVEAFDTINLEIILGTPSESIQEMIIEEFLESSSKREAELIAFELLEAFARYAPAWVVKGRLLDAFKLKPVTRAEHKVGRNDPCPCGSGKKYKKCCME